MTTTEPTSRSEEQEQDYYAPGRNAVEVKPLGGRGGYYRSYEIYQRQRLKDSQHLMNPRLFLRTEYLRDPYPVVKVMRDNYEFYRDWINNCDWAGRYNDVTSLFTDDANFETRPKLWFYQMEGYGRDLRGQMPVLWAWANGVEGSAEPVIDELLSGFVPAGSSDLIGDFTFRYPGHLLASALGLPRSDWDRFNELYRTMMEGWQWEPVREQAGKDAIAEMTALIARYFAERRRNPGEDLLSAVACLSVEGGETTPEDVTTTLLEGDGDTLLGGLATTWYHLMMRPDQLALVLENPMLVKRAWQETLRHTTPILQWRRFALREVERYGRLIPEGGLVMLSAAAGNRDERIFNDPDRFDTTRADLCFREPRGQYRADGLPAGIAFGLGRPSKHPAVPEDRPRSLYAITTDLAVQATRALLSAVREPRVKPGTEPELFSRWPWDIHTCWDLQVEFEPA